MVKAYSQHMNWTELQFSDRSSWTLEWTAAENWLSTDRPSFAAANQYEVVVTWLIRASRVDLFRSVQFSLVRVLWTNFYGSGYDG